MKRQPAGLVFSDGSFIFIMEPRLKQSSMYHYLTRDLNNHPSWVDYKIERGEDIINFVSQFKNFKSKN